jgi:hypothetical protein
MTWRHRWVIYYSSLKILTQDDAASRTTASTLNRRSWLKNTTAASRTKMPYQGRQCHVKGDGPALITSPPSREQPPRPQLTDPTLRMQPPPQAQRCYVKRSNSGLESTVSTSRRRVCLEDAAAASRTRAPSSRRQPHWANDGPIESMTTLSNRCWPPELKPVPLELKTALPSWSRPSAPLSRQRPHWVDARPIKSTPALSSWWRPSRVGAGPIQSTLSSRC